MRFTGQVTIERIGSDPAPETATAPALRELMYFGKDHRLNRQRDGPRPGLERGVPQPRDGHKPRRSLVVR